jgi:glyceraldehyde 3-phosphate dehydrogenase
LESNIHLFKHDSIHGNFTTPIRQLKSGLKIGKQNITCFSERDPANLPWEKLNIDIVLECTGIFTSRDGASKHLKAGAKKVLISAPGSEVDLTVVYGVNHKKIKPKHKIISNASCTTNCLAPVAMVLDKLCGINQGYMTTVHAFTGDQAILDTLHSDKRRARSASQSIIPTSTGAAKAVGKIIPSVDGKLTGMAFRVPVANVSVVDLSVNLKTETDYTHICNSIKSASEGSLKNVLAYSDALCVSSDFVTNPHTSVFDANAGLEISKTFFKLVSWYDNEWGYSNKILDMIIHMYELN